jgi:Domain of unknown function (DUF6907)
MSITTDQIAELDEIIAGAPIAPANAGHPLAEAPYPYWQVQPCPPWCMMTVPHQDHDMTADRVHASAFRHIDLTLEDARTDRSGPGRKLVCEPAHLAVQLIQEYRERDPRVVVTVNSETDLYLTVAEAAGLAQGLAALVGSGSAGEDQCPPWCIGAPHTEPCIRDRSHVGEYTMMNLTIADLIEVVDLGKPRPDGADGPHLGFQFIGIRLWQGLPEYEASVDFLYNDHYLSLALAEATELAENLSALTREAAGPLPVASPA